VVARRRRGATSAALRLFAAADLLSLTAGRRPAHSARPGPCIARACTGSSRRSPAPRRPRRCQRRRSCELVAAPGTNRSATPARGQRQPVAHSARPILSIRGCVISLLLSFGCALSSAQRLSLFDPVTADTALAHAARTAACTGGQVAHAGPASALCLAGPPVHRWPSPRGARRQQPLTPGGAPCLIIRPLPWPRRRLRFARARARASRRSRSALVVRDASCAPTQRASPVRRVVDASRFSHLQALTDKINLYQALERERVQPRRCWPRWEGANRSSTFTFRARST
jgi:hypothetical protein